MIQITAAVTEHALLILTYPLRRMFHNLKRKQCVKTTRLLEAAVSTTDFTATTATAVAYNYLLLTIVVHALLQRQVRKDVRAIQAIVSVL